jgi:molybdopterin-containing oxidoreductase family iron-sulfur binding subunit
MEENSKNIDRSDFIRKSLTVLATGLAGGVLLNSLEGCNSDNSKKELSGKKIPLLNAEGNLIYVDEAHIGVHKDFKGVTNEEARKGVPGKKFVMVIDLAKCDGCGKCTEACNKMHYLPKNKEWIEVLEMQDSPETASYWFPKTCMHCDNPPCTKVCPVDATFKREDGIVAIDNERCVGCRFCMAACPYSVRLFNWNEPAKPEFVEDNNLVEHAFASKKGCVEKCDFCPHMAREGKLPGCVTGCPQNAIYFGDQNEDAVTCLSGETLKLSQLLEDRAAYRFMEELGTEPRVYYLPPYNRLYPKPEMKES